MTAALSPAACLARHNPQGQKVIKLDSPPLHMTVQDQAEFEKDQCRITGETPKMPHWPSLTHFSNLLRLVSMVPIRDKTWLELQPKLEQVFLSHDDWVGLGWGRLETAQYQALPSV
eukprot:2557590-Rhodomonas_salina.1